MSETHTHAGDIHLSAFENGDGAERFGFDPVSDGGWDVRLATFPKASFFHSEGWIRVLRDTYGYRPVFCSHYSPSEGPSVLLLMEVDSWLTGRRGVSLPFTDACAPLAADARSFPGLFKRALDVGRSRGWKYLECRGGKELLGDVPSSTSFHGHVLDLRPPESTLFSGFSSSCRRAVRKAEQSGATIEISQEVGALLQFYGLLRQTRKRHGMLPQPFAFFANIHRHVIARNQGWVVLARDGGVPIAGAVFFGFGTSAVFKFGASDEAFQNLRANNLVMWEAIRHLKQLGYTSLDLGRTSLKNEGLRRFKLDWGTTEYPIDYAKFDLKAGRFVAAKDASSGWHNSIFRHLPGRLGHILGSLLYKHAA